MSVLAAWCVRHRGRVIAGWVAAMVLALGLSQAVGGAAYADSLSLPGTGSGEALELLEDAAPENSGDVEQIVVGTTDGAPVTDPAVREPVSAMLAEVAALDHVTSVVSPYDESGAGQISEDGDIAFATVTFDAPNWELPTELADELVDTVEAAEREGLQAGVSGQLAGLTTQQPPSSTGIALLAAGVVLALVFGSLFATLLPLASTIAALGTGIGVIGLLSHVMNVPQMSVEMVPLIGLGVGIDYALFIVTRHRQALEGGNPIDAAIVTAVNTAGRAVLFAGIIVCIAIFGMYTLGVDFFYGVIVATAIAVALVMFASLTLLPALLSLIGMRVYSRRWRRRHAAGSAESTGAPARATAGTATEDTGFWARWGAGIARRPLLAAIAGVAVIAVVALPFLSMRLGIADQGNHRDGTTTRQAYDLLSDGFGPGFNGPLQVVSVVDDEAQRAAFERLVTAIGDEPGVAAVTPPQVLPAQGGGDVALAVAYPGSAPQDEETADLIRHLRDVTVPETTGDSGIEVFIGGSNAIFIDLTKVISDRLPLFIAGIVGLSFLVLALVFRSVLIPVTAAIMNVLSIAAALGVVIAVFQWGWLKDLLGVPQTGPTEAYMPVMLFAILFGLSMDYQVFLLSRVHEEWLRTGDDRAAVTLGLARTGRTITAAAAIMICVFASFCLGDDRIIKQFGLGLAAGVLIDALIIRSLLVPAVMILLGRANWWFPRSLDRALPRVALEADGYAADGGEPERPAGRKAPEPVS